MALFRRKSKQSDRTQLLPSWPVHQTPLALTTADDPLTILSSQPALRKVTDFIARNVARVPLQAFDLTGDTRTPLTHGPLATIVAHPEPYRSRYRFWYDTVMDWLLYDRFAVVMLSGGTPSLIRLSPRNWEFHTVDGGDGTPDGIIATGHPSSAPMSLDGVFWDRGFGADQGVSPIRTLSQVLQEYSESVKWRRAIWKNGARMTGIWNMDPSMPMPSPEAQKRLETDLANYMDGGGSEGKVPVGIGLNWIPVQTFSPKDTQEVEGRTLADIEVASAYGVPPEMIGARQANYGSTQAFRSMLYRETLGPLFTQLEDAFNAQIVERYWPGCHVEFSLEAALRGSFEEDAVVTSQAVGGPWMSVNQAREAHGMPSAGPEYDKIITQLNTVRGGGTQASPHDSGSQNVSA
ncbi:MAG: phage portal protein [Bifidobacterium sp.]|uniref:phage portal protein n=1 Tax=Bifidobacterium sp. TaxID=41200 RepID=UPI0039E9D6C9